jgi:uncharacterized protein
MSQTKTAALSTRPFMVMAKPVGARCNMRCSYCYYLNPETDTAPRIMSETLLEQFIHQYIEASEGPVVQFVWHGGEPTLAGLDFYKHAVQMQKRYLPEGWRCWNNLQTNGILLDDNWCAFLADAHFDVGLSIDGTQLVHDAHRKDTGGRGTHHLAAAAIARLKARGIQPDLLCTITPLAADNALAVYRALRDFRTGWIQFIPIVRRDINDTVTPESVTPEQYGEFLCGVFDEWLINDLGTVNIQMFAELTRIYSGGSSGLCWMAPTCGRALIVESNGSVYSCDHFVNPDHYIGSIESAHLRDLAHLPVQLQFGDAKREKLATQCRTCQWLSVCGGGCPKDRTPSENGVYALCGGLRRFYSYSQPAFKQLVTSANAGLAPGSIMEQFRAHLKAVWKNVSRNDPCPCGSGRKAKHCCWEKRL